MDDDERPADDLTPSAAVLRAGLAMSELDLPQLWVGYLGLGGSMTQAELTEVLRGQRQIIAYEHDLLTQALNDDFTSRGQDHPVPYAEDVDRLADRPRRGISGG